MKLLFENWRKFVNEVEGKQIPLPGMEGEIEPNDPEGIYEKHNIYPGIAKKLLKMKERGFGVALNINQSDDQNVAFFYELDQFGPDSPDPTLTPRSSSKNAVHFSETNWKCNTIPEVYEINLTNAELYPGLGPVLYEAALEIASDLAGGLVSDRSSVSDYARSVWEYYEGRADVETIQLDINHDATELPDDLKGGDKDEAIEQCKSEYGGGNHHEDWTLEAEEYLDREDYTDEDGDFDEHEWDQAVQEKSDEIEEQRIEEYCEDYDGYSHFLASIEVKDFPQLTPDDVDDDCSQTSSLEHAVNDGSGGEDWFNQSISKAYYKPLKPMLKWLKQNNMLLFTNEEIEL